MYQYINKNALLAEYSGDEEVLFQLIEVFLARYESLLADLSTALEKKDSKSIAQKAHTLHGELSAIGGQQLATLVKEIERSAANKQTGDLYQKLKQNIEAFVKEIQLLMNEATIL